MYIACSFVKKKKHWIFIGSQEYFYLFEKAGNIECPLTVHRLWKQNCENIDFSYYDLSTMSENILSTWAPNKDSNQLAHLHSLVRFFIIHMKKHCIRLAGWLSWMRRPTGDQEVIGSTPAEVGNILSWRLIMKYFLRWFSPLCWFKKGSCQFLAKECAQYWLTA